MASKLTKMAFKKLIEEDIAWLEKQRRTLERDHIISIVKECPVFYYDVMSLLGDIYRESSMTTGLYERIEKMLEKYDSNGHPGIEDHKPNELDYPRGFDFPSKR